MEACYIFRSQQKDRTKKLFTFMV
ncbi:BnaA03g60510D [Brassica napus]|uniref:BnaA03g60510D protein n=1 Tax=Brassica napus TaxID=3708 RepID=A0A078H3L6_BRANA|nr:BnaA03g60510D [Brassica napus]